jgi:hypothetical protein
MVDHTAPDELSRFQPQSPSTIVSNTSLQHPHGSSNTNHRTISPLGCGNGAMLEKGLTAQRRTVTGFHPTATSFVPASHIHPFISTGFDPSSSVSPGATHNHRFEASHSRTSVPNSGARQSSSFHVFGPWNTFVPNHLNADIGMNMRTRVSSSPASGPDLPLPASCNCQTSQHEINDPKTPGRPLRIAHLNVETDSLGRPKRTSPGSTPRAIRFEVENFSALNVRIEKLEHGLVILRRDMTNLLQDVLRQLAREPRCPCLRQSLCSDSPSDATFYSATETRTNSTEAGDAIRGIATDKHGTVADGGKLTAASATSQDVMSAHD